MMRKSQGLQEKTPNCHRIFYYGPTNRGADSRDEWAVYSFFNLDSPMDFGVELKRFHSVTIAVPSLTITEIFGQKLIGYIQARGILINDGDGNAAIE
jgi:hypothetical protein